MGVVLVMVVLHHGGVLEMMQPLSQRYMRSATVHK